MHRVSPGEDDGKSRERIHILPDKSEVVTTVLVFIPLAVGLALVPILMPFGDPYRVTVVGYFMNMSYFLWYTGLGWSFLWAVHVGWYLQFRRLVEHIAVLHTGFVGPQGWQSDEIFAVSGKAPLLLTLSKAVFRLCRRKSVWVPTLFPVLLFFAAYTILGGPFPLATLILGLPCFVFSWWSLWRFEGTGTRPLLASDGSQVQEVHHGGLAKSLIPFYALTVMNLVGYFVLQCIISLFPKYNDCVAVAFSTFPDVMQSISVHGSVKRIADQLKPDTSSTAKKEDSQALLEEKHHELQDLLERTHHELHTLSLLFQTFFYYGLHVTYLNFLFPVCGSLSNVLVGAVVIIAKEVLSGMKPMLDGEMTLLLEKLSSNLEDRGEAGKIHDYIDHIANDLAEQIFIKLTRCFLDSLVPVTFAAVLAFDKFSWNAGMLFVLGDLSPDEFWVVLRNLSINLSAAVVACSIYLFMLKRAISQCRVPDEAGGTKWTVEGKVLQSALTKLQHHVSAVCYHPGQASGMFFLLLFTQAAISTVVGVCMVMKHDGMDAKGVMEWAFHGGEFPWRLNPLWERGGKGHFIFLS